MQSTAIVAPKATAAIGTSLTAVGGYTPAGATGAIVTGLSVCNVTGSAVNVTVTMFNGTTDFNLAFATPVAAGDSLLLGAEWFKFTFVNGWNVRVKSSVAASVDAVMFVTEFT